MATQQQIDAFIATLELADIDYLTSAIDVKSQELNSDTISVSFTLSGSPAVYAAFDNFKGKVTNLGGSLTNYVETRP